MKRNSISIVGCEMLRFGGCYGKVAIVGMRGIVI